MHYIFIIMKISFCQCLQITACNLVKNTLGISIVIIE